MNSRKQFNFLLDNKSRAENTFKQKQTHRNLNHISWDGHQNMIFSTSTINRLKTSPRIAKMISALSWGVRILDKLFTSRFSRSLLNIDKSFSPLFWFSSSLLLLDNSFSSKVRISSSLLIKDKSFSMEFWFLSSLLFCCGRQCSTFGPQPALRDRGYRPMHCNDTLEKDKSHWKGDKECF